MIKARILLSLLSIAAIGPGPAQAGTTDAASDGKKVAVGFIDKKGKFAIKPRFVSALDFSEGLVWAKPLGDPATTEAVDKKGGIKFAVKGYRWPGDFHDGLAPIRTDEGTLYGYISTSGKIAIPCQFVQAGPFRNGQATVTNDRGQKIVIDRAGICIHRLGPETSHSEDIKSCGKAVLSETGRLKFEPSEQTQDKSYTHFSEGFAWVRLISSEASEQFAYITQDRYIAFQLGPEIEKTGDFHDGLAPVLLRVKAVDNLGREVTHRLGFIDTKGELVIPAKFPADHLENVRFSEGLARLRLDANTCCYVDKKGRTLGPFFWGRVFHDGLARVSALIDSQGKIINSDNAEYGYQSRSSYALALLKLLQPKLSNLSIDQLIEFWVDPADTNIPNIEITKSSGNADLDAKLISLVKEIQPPKRGLLLPRSTPFTFRLLDGKLSHGFTRFPGQSPLADEDL